MNPILMEALVESIAFLELSGDDVINPDAAVAQLEQVGAILQELTPEDRTTFTRYVKDKALAEQRTTGLSRRVEFLLAFPGSFGLEE